MRFSSFVNTCTCMPPNRMIEARCFMLFVSLCVFNFVFFNLYETKCLYLVCIFLVYSTFRWYQHWLSCDLTLTLLPQMTPQGSRRFAYTSDILVLSNIIIHRENDWSYYENFTIIFNEKTLYLLIDVALFYVMLVAKSKKECSFKNGPLESDIRYMSLLTVFKTV